jgi:hypothetical protein
MKKKLAYALPILLAIGVIGFGTLNSQEEPVTHKKVQQATEHNKELPKEEQVVEEVVEETVVQPEPIVTPTAPEKPAYYYMTGQQIIDTLPDNPNRPDSWDFRMACVARGIDMRPEIKEYAVENGLSLEHMVTREYGRTAHGHLYNLYGDSYPSSPQDFNCRDLRYLLF